MLEKLLSPELQKLLEEGKTLSDLLKMEISMYDRVILSTLLELSEE